MSPHDLTAYLADPLVAWFDRLDHELRHDPRCPFVLDIPRERLKPDEPDAEMQLIVQAGLKHEAEHTYELARRGGLLLIDETGDRWRQTIDAMLLGQPIIAQGELRHGRLSGRPDFLVRVDTPSKLGKWSYIPRDAKLSRLPKPQHVVQLCAYAWMLHGVQGLRPATIEFALGTKRVMSLPTERFYYYFLQLLDATLRFHDAFDPERPPDVGLARDFDRWSTVSRLLLENADHLRRTAGITLSQVQRLESAGVRTMRALADRRQPVPRMEPATLEKLRQQAALQIRSVGKLRPEFAPVRPDPGDPARGLALLPRPDPADLFFDMEGFPLEEDGLEYLFGLVLREKGKLRFRDWWAHDAAAEKAAFEQFIDFVHARWRKNRALHIYHYALYETTALRRLMGKHATREEQVDDLLRNRVFVDLYTVVRQGVRIGTGGYSLKDIEPLFAPPRSGAVKTAAGSVVAYEAWRDSDEPDDWQRSPILKEIRDYNEIDCRSLVLLRDWLVSLRDRLPKSKPGGRPTTSSTQPRTKRVSPSAELAERLLDELDRGTVRSAARSGRQRLLAYLLDFYWRERKPMFWRMFDRAGMSDEQLADDIDCLASLRFVRHDPATEADLYEFDPGQDSKLDAGDRCLVADDLQLRCTIVSIDFDRGRCALRFGNGRAPKRLSLIPDEDIPPLKQQAALYRYVEAWSKGSSLSRAVDDLLDRRRPRLKRRSSEAIVDASKPLLPQLTRVIADMDRTTLCVQGPPGTGKTYCTGQVIADLLRAGKRVGVTALSHKAILKTLDAVVEAMRQKRVDAEVLKVTGTGDAEEQNPHVRQGLIGTVSSSAGVLACAERAPLVIGGTSFFFARAELAGALDYLFIDEAGQFSLANCIAVGLAARNLVLVGDPMQLAQPVQGTHPGESGLSGLEYLLNGRATVPPDLGVLLDCTYRLHPDLCSLVSRMTYDARLHAHRQTIKRFISPAPSAKLLSRRAGVLFIPVEHVGNTQCADEEIEVIEQLVKELRRSELVVDRARRRLTLDDLLFVAPFNMQVSRLRRRLGSSARVGSVDKFQGQEAPVVIVSMCSSSLEDSPRGIDFLLSPNRLNVAISRAQCLAIVVASPRLLSPRCTTLKQMEQVNRLCWIEHHAHITK